MKISVTYEFHLGHWGTVPLERELGINLHYVCNDNPRMLRRIVAFLDFLC